MPIYSKKKESNFKLHKRLLETGKDDHGNDVYFSNDSCGIAPIGFLGMSLLNIYSSILDKEFSRTYPNFIYLLFVIFMRHIS